MARFFHKRKLLCLLILLALMLLILRLSFTAELHAPVLSHSSGFYEEDFYLNITSLSGAEIYYTLDGSDPDENALRYTGPIPISDASLNENLYSARTDTSTGFYEDLIRQYDPHHTILNYRAPDFLVDKCTILRAVAIDSTGRTSETVSASYFVGIRPEDYLGCNIISIITDPDNLFGADRGIYVTGTTFENYLAKGDPSGGWYNWPANYRNRGPEWERPVSFQIFDSSGQLALSREGGIRVRGSATRGFIPRSLNIFTRQEYDGLDSFGIPLFGNDYIPEAVTLTSGGNAFVTQFNDFAITQMVGGLNVATTRFAPYVLFLDGEYWGFYWLSEKFDEAYFNHYYGVAEDNVVMIKFRTKARTDLVEIGLEEDLQLYLDMENFFLENDMSDPANYEKAIQIIDIDSCIDYFASMIYIARRSDWPNGNIGLWRSRESTGSGYSDGRWRWVVFDCNGACMRGGVDAPTGAILEGHDTLSLVLETDPVFASLWKNADFRQAFQERILHLADTCFNADTMKRFVDDYQQIMTPIMGESWARFYGSENDMLRQFDEIIETYHLFFSRRKAYVESWFDETA